MPGTDNVDHVEVIALDDAVQMHIEKIQTWCGSPMTQQAWLAMFPLERLA